MTIPKQFFDELQLGDKVSCQIINNALTIKLIQKDLGFSNLILYDLIKEGYEAGEDLSKGFTYRKSQISVAIHGMVEDSKNYRTYTTVDELFDSLNDEDENESFSKNI